MTKITMTAFAIFALVVVCACKSPPVAINEEENVIDEKLPFINTNVDASGKVYSIRVFDEIVDVSLLDKNTKETLKSFTNDEYSYNPDTTEVSLASYTDDVVRISGRRVFPDTFVLAGYKKDKGAPGIFIDGHIAENGIEYAFDSDSCRLTFASDIDIEQLPYTIVWPTSYGVCSCADHIDDAGDVYEKFVSAWLLEQSAK